MNSSQKSQIKDRYRILYVGSSLTLLDLLNRSLGPAGCRVVRCPGGLQARLFIQSNIRYDLLVLDEQLMGVDRLDLMHLTRLLTHRQQIPIVINTARNHVIERNWAGSLAGNSPGVHALVLRIQRILLGGNGQ